MEAQYRSPRYEWRTNASFPPGWTGHRSWLDRMIDALRTFRPARSCSEKDSNPMAMAANEIEALIKAALPDARITVEDLAGDGDHYAANLVSETFRGISRVKQ